jgi:hypothetical protein
MRRLGAILALAAGLAGCGAGEPRSAEGTATVWVTRDRGSHVLLVKSVPAGLTAMQALDRVADVGTRYGGRYVQSINGLAGSISAQRDWFYFVNGYEADRSAVEYRLHPGDVEWWDFRSWRATMRAPVVVGAFPEPFLHGYGGRRRPAAVRYGGVSLAPGAHAIGRLIGADSVAPMPTPAPPGANVLMVVEGLVPRFGATYRGRSTAPGNPVSFTFVGDASRLARNPRLVRFRYQWLPRR